MTQHSLRRTYNGKFYRATHFTILPIEWRSPAVWYIALVIAGASIGVLSYHLGDSLDAVAVQISLAALIVMVMALRAWHITRSNGYGDVFHPCLFPMLYVAFSFLAPMWMAFVVGDPPRALSRSTPISSISTALLVVGVLSFSFATLATARFDKPKPLKYRFTGATALRSGQILITVPIGISAISAFQGRVATRGADQASTNITDTFDALLTPVAIAAVTLMLMGNRVLKNEKLLSRIDLVEIMILLALTAARGTRGDIFAVVLLITVAHAHRRGKYRTIAVAGVLMLVAAVGVLQYRIDAKGGQVDHTATEMILGDMAVAGYTTGATAAVVPDAQPYEYGRTYVEAMMRQLPSPIATPMFGEPDHTGPRIFREIVGLNNPNQGYGFSIPAEGYLNFGIGGIVFACGLLGLLYAWAYPRMSFVNGRLSGVLYPVLVSALPFGLRADSLGFAKNVLYPLVAIGIVLVVARAQYRREVRAPEKSNASRHKKEGASVSSAGSIGCVS